MARYVASETEGECEFAVTVADDWQGKGLAVLLMRELTVAARDRGFKIIEGLVFASNQRMLDLARKLGFEVASISGESETVRVHRPL